jgi:hypothetical protein
MWRFYALLIEMVSFLYGLRLLIKAENKSEWSSTRTLFAVETGCQTGGIKRVK